MPRNTWQLDECKCGKLKRISSEQCKACNKQAKRAAARDAVAALGLMPQKTQRGRAVACKCKTCGVDCKSSISMCRTCRRKSYNTAYYSAVDAAAKVVGKDGETDDTIRAAIERVKDKLVELKQPIRCDDDLSFSEGLVRTCKLPEDAKPWRCSGCGGSILWEFTRCVRCDVQRVLTQAEIESLALEIVI